MYEQNVLSPPPPDAYTADAYIRQIYVSTVTNVNKKEKEKGEAGIKEWIYLALTMDAKRHSVRRKFHAFPLFFTTLFNPCCYTREKRDHRNMKVLMSSLANEERVCSGEHPFLVLGMHTG